jgi:hypothetical protein
VNSDFDESLLDVFWSLWGELGIPSTRRNHRDVAIDPEALIVFSASLMDGDARLRDEIASWCISFDRFLSKTRMRNIARGQSPAVATAFFSFAAALNEKAGLAWPRGKSRPITVSPRIREIDREWTSRPAAVALRLRGLVGVGSRAEVLRALLAYPDAALSAPEIAAHVFFARRNVAEALDMLELAGVVESVRERATLRYSLSRFAPLSGLVGELPPKFPHWPELFALLLDLRAVLSQRKSTGLLRAIEGQRFFEAHAFAIARNGLPTAPPIAAGYETWSHLEEWAHKLIRAVAHNREDILQTPKIRPTFLRLRRARAAQGRLATQVSTPGR